MAKYSSKTIKVNAGIPGLFRLLSALPKESQDEVRSAAQEIAGTIAAEARSSYQGSNGAWAFIAPTIQAKRDRVPSVQAGGTRLLPGRGKRPKRDNQRLGNVLWGVEFGSDRYRQFDPWTGNDEGAGYAIYPAFRRLGDWARESYVDALMKATLDASRRA